jgi:YkoY family integral membrane protein
LFGQTFESHDLIVLGVLVVLEGVLSLDNALVLGLLARQLPHRLQQRALMYGLVGAFVFRILAILLAGFLLNWRLPKLLGGLYLIYVAVKHFLIEEKTIVQKNTATPGPIEVDLTTHSRQFWWTVGSIELTDIAFAVDSIVAAVALISTGPLPEGREINPKLWLVVVGGMMGVILMRFAAIIFIRLLEKFPRLETSAYLLVLVIGGKLVLDYVFNRYDHDRLNFHSIDAPAFWTFWALMLICFAIGFIPRRQITGRITDERG